MWVVPCAHLPNTLSSFSKGPPQQPWRSHRPSISHAHPHAAALDVLHSAGDRGCPAPAAAHGEECLRWADRRLCGHAGVGQWGWEKAGAGLSCGAAQIRSRSKSTWLPSTAWLVPRPWCRRSQLAASQRLHTAPCLCTALLLAEPTEPSPWPAGPGACWWTPSWGQTR